MKLNPTARLCGVTVALVVASFSDFAVAQAQPSPRAFSSEVEAAVLNLPDAPMPQPSSSEASSGLAAGSSSSSFSDSSQAAAPASGDNAVQPPAATTPSAEQGCSTTPSPVTPGTTPPTSVPACSTAPPGKLPDAPSAADVKQQRRDEAEREIKVQEKQRLLGVMPQFQVVMGGQAVPLTGGEKWRLALHTAIDPFYIGWAFVIGGGYGELIGSDSGYDWGPGGYFKRVGANYADNVNGALIGNALLPQLLHQDPRYFRKGTGSIKSRFIYAALSTVICHGDNGKRQANVSNVFGNYISGAISNAYYPEQERGLKLTLQNGTSVTLFGALGGQVLEFGPDLARLVHHKKNGIPSTSVPTDPVTPATGSQVQTSPAPAVH